MFIYSVCRSKGLTDISFILLLCSTCWRFLYVFCSFDISFNFDLLLFVIWKIFNVKRFLHIMVSNNEKLEGNFRSESLSSPNFWITGYGLCFKVILYPTWLNEFMYPVNKLETLKLHFSFSNYFWWYSRLVVCLHFFFWHSYLYPIAQNLSQVIHLNPFLAKTHFCYF